LMALHESRLGTKLETLDGSIQGLKHGGMELHRPLLEFPKSSLITTCDANGIPYVRDKTNFDPSFTKRNAIRVLRTHHALPRALQDRSLLNLSQIARDTLEAISKRALDALRGISILAFDFRSGTVHLRVPVGLSHLVGEDNNVAAYLISKLSSLVSARPADDHDTLAPGSIVSLFWRCLEGSFWSTSGHSSPPMFTYNGVLFEGIKPPRQISGTSSIWRLSRAPLTQRERSNSAVAFSSPHGRKQLRGPNLSKWLLWDYRYWIRVGVGVQNQEMRASRAHDLLNLIGIRAYTAEDSAIIKARMSEDNWKLLQKTLHEAAEGKIRFTLPVLTCNGEIVAFPTLSRFLICANEFRTQARAFGFGDSATLSWSVAYKLLPKNISQWGSSISSTLVVPRVVRQLQNESDGVFAPAPVSHQQRHSRPNDQADQATNIQSRQGGAYG
jgi:hypothetical protein